MGLNILLINIGKEDPEERDYFDGKVTSHILKGIRGYGIYPLSLPLIAALTPDRHNVTIVDENIEACDLSVDYDIVGFTAMTWQAPRVYKLAGIYRKRKIHTVIGGIHATMLPEEASQYVDTVISGEAEISWPLFLREFEEKRQRKIYNDTGSIDLDMSPTPRYDLIKREYYLHDVVQISRGCPYTCNFCSVHKYLGGKVRIKSPDRIYEDIKAVKENFKRRIKTRTDKPVIVFNDDNIAVNSEKLGLITRHLEDRDMVPDYSLCETSIDRIKEPGVVGILKRLNCIKVFVGFESLSTRILSLQNKNINLHKDYSGVIKNLRQNGMDIIASFIIGNDKETDNDMKNIIGFINENHITNLLLNILTPYPGTGICDEFEKHGRIATKDWSQYDIKNVVFNSESADKDEIRQSWINIYDRTLGIEQYRKNLISKFKEIENSMISFNETLDMILSSFLPLIRSLNYKKGFSYMSSFLPLLISRKLDIVKAYDIIQGLDTQHFIKSEKGRTPIR